MSDPLHDLGSDPEPSTVELLTVAAAALVQSIIKKRGERAAASAVREPTALPLRPTVSDLKRARIDIASKRLDRYRAPRSLRPPLLNVSSLTSPSSAAESCLSRSTILRPVRDKNSIG
jgi:hypothetical protein